MKLQVHAALVTLAAGAAAIAAAPPVAKVPAGNPAMGARLFLQCRACHTVGAGQADGVGPNLNNVVGAKAGARPGFAYSPAMAKSNVMWDAATLDRFLARPTAAVPGTRMAFAGVAAPKSRADLIAYMATLKAAKR